MSRDVKMSPPVLKNVVSQFEGGVLETSKGSCSSSRGAPFPETKQPFLTLRPSEPVALQDFSKRGELK